MVLLAVSVYHLADSFVEKTEARRLVVVGRGIDLDVDRHPGRAGQIEG